VGNFSNLINITRIVYLHYMETGPLNLLDCTYIVYASQWKPVCASRQDSRMYRKNSLKTYGQIDLQHFILRQSSSCNTIPIPFHHTIPIFCAAFGFRKLKLLRMGFYHSIYYYGSSRQSISIANLQMVPSPILKL